MHRAKLHNKKIIINDGKLKAILPMTALTYKSISIPQ